MASYRPYLSLSVTHSYLRFLNSAVLPVTFDLTEETQYWLKQHQMFARVLQGGMCIFLDQQTMKHIPPPQEDVQLQFKLYSQDRYFRNYTEIPLTDPLSIAYFNVVIGSELNLKVTPILWQNIGQIQNTFGSKVIQPDDLSRNMIGIVNITIPAEYYHQTNKQLTLSYSHTEAYWQYYFPFLPMATDYIITEPNNRYSFEYKGQLTLNHREVMTFSSKTKLPLLKHSDLTLQLRNSHRVVYRRLPLAIPNDIEIITHNGAQQRLCHVYVS